MNHTIRKRKSFDMSSDTNNFNNIFVDNTTMLLKTSLFNKDAY